jgi:hypothetical protein
MRFQFLSAREKKVFHEQRTAMIFSALHRTKVPEKPPITYTLMSSHFNRGSSQDSLGFDVRVCTAYCLSEYYEELIERIPTFLPVLF